MKKTALKAISLAVVAATGLSVLTACGDSASGSSAASSGSSGSSSGSSSSSSDASSAEKQVEKPKSIKFMNGGGLNAEQYAEEWRQEFVKKTGIELEFTPTTSSEYYQKLDLAFSSGDAPDVFGLGGTYISHYAAQGALADITGLCEASPIIGAVDAATLDSTRVDGKLYGVPSEQGGGAVTYMRKDWLEKAGKTIPDTYDEFIDVLRAFKEIQPDVIPYTAAGLYSLQAEMYLPFFYQDASPEFVKVNGKWVDGMAQDNMLAAVTRLADAYAEGLIDVEIITNKTSTCRDKWFAGKVGAFTYWAGHWGQNLDVRLKANIPDASVVAIPAIKETQYMRAAPGILAISKTSSNVEGVFKYFIEYAHDGAEGTVLFENGVEGLHWEMGENNTVVGLPNPTNPSEVFTVAMIAPSFSLTRRLDGTPQYILDEGASSSLAVLNENPKQLDALPVSKTLSTISSDLSALKDSTLASIALGQITPEEGLENYRKAAEKLNVAAVLDELNA